MEYKSANSILLHDANLILYADGQGDCMAYECKSIGYCIPPIVAVPILRELGLPADYLEEYRPVFEKFRRHYGDDFSGGEIKSLGAKTEDGLLHVEFVSGEDDFKTTFSYSGVFLVEWADNG